jgi:hypothetical protein
MSSLRATALLPSPSAAARTILDRTATALADVARLDHPVSWVRCSSVKATAGATGSGMSTRYELGLN